MPRLSLIASIIATCFATVSANSQTPPAGFVDELVVGGFSDSVGVVFDEVGRAFAWEHSGRVWLLSDPQNPQQQLLLDISDEVGSWVNHGLLGFALDPNFLANGYVYLLYAVDAHHLFNSGTPDYDPEIDAYEQPTIGRLTRYTVNEPLNDPSVDLGSRFILLGDTPATGAPIMQASHGVGTILFGSDGTMLVSFGDGASFTTVDAGGGGSDSYAVQGLKDGILAPKEDVGAFRSQLIDTLAGKVIRIDPATGDGVPSNPFYDNTAPRAPRSQVWVLGLRNPYRMTIRPGTGSNDPMLANPGVLYIGDVGWGEWEDINVATAAGQNFGWPIFEGLERLAPYDNLATENPDAPNPLYRPGSCDVSHFPFRALIHQATLDPDPFFPNPCDPQTEIPDDINTFVHTPPAIEFGHNGVARTSVFVNGQFTVVNLDEPDSPVDGPQFGGFASIGGAWYECGPFPSRYHNTYFHADHIFGWIRNFVFDNNDEPLAVRDELFASGAGIVDIEFNPFDGALYYVNLSEIRRIRFTGKSLPGDLTGDGCIDQSDLGVMLAAFNLTSLGDIDCDGLTTQADLGILLSSFNEGCR